MRCHGAVQVVWGPLLAVLSMATETADDPKVVELCIDGFRSAVHVAAVLGMSTERHALVTVLCKFTTLDASGVSACTPAACGPVYSTLLYSTLLYSTLLYSTLRTVI